jgi:hypothetical protein
MQRRSFSMRLRTVMLRFGALALSAFLSACTQANVPRESAPAAPSSHAGPTSSAASSAVATMSPGASETPPSDPAISGDVPGPDATIHPGSPLLAGVTLDGLVATAASLGMECSSGPGAPPGWPGGFGLGCEGNDGSNQTRLGLSVLYWTFDGVVSLEAVVRPHERGVIDEGIANQLLLPIAQQVGGDAAHEWVSTTMHDPSCRGGCDFTVNGVMLTLHVADTGTRLLDVDPGSRRIE